MNRRTFFAAVAPIVAMAGPAFAQAPIGSEASAPVGRLKTDGGAPAAAPADEKVPKKAKGPTEITAREGSYSNRDSKAIFTGEVVVKDPEFHITCDRLTAFLKKPKAKAANGAEDPQPIGVAADAPPAAAKKKDDSGLDRAEAEGNVIITQEKTDASGKVQRYVGKAKRAIYEDASGKVKLYGWPQIGEVVGGKATRQTVAAEESCVITVTRDGNISWENGRATVLLPNDDTIAPNPKPPQNANR